MRVLKQIYDVPWDFILYKTESDYIMNIEYSNSAVDFTRSFKLTNEEAKQSLEELKKLSQEIRSNYESFKDREIIPAVRK